MCGRYAHFLRPAEVRQQLQQAHMPSEEAPNDDDVRLTYNFAPGSHGLVYRADVPDSGAGTQHRQDGEETKGEGKGHADAIKTEGSEGSHATSYKLQAMKWGLVPFWTKRKPDYGSTMKTINCRDDSLLESRGMWNTMKHKKRCIVVCQGFYEWLKKNGGKEKIPHFVKRKDGQLMCFGGLWDCVKLEDSEEKLYTYTIITTSSNKQLGFLHDRMPVILDNGSEDLRTWLDPSRTEWNKELQSLLKPYGGELECYPVSKEVGKVGNNSPTFIVPIDSAENKNNIANFFGNQKKAGENKGAEKQVTKYEENEGKAVKVEHEVDEQRATWQLEGIEDNAALPVAHEREEPRGIKGEHGGIDEAETEQKEGKHKAHKTSSDGNDNPTVEAVPKAAAASTKKKRSATTNERAGKKRAARAADGNRKITAFLAK